MIPLLAFTKRKLVACLLGGMKIPATTLKPRAGTIALDTTVLRATKVAVAGPLLIPQNTTLQKASPPMAVAKHLSNAIIPPMQLLPPKSATKKTHFDSNKALYCSMKLSPPTASPFRDFSNLVARLPRMLQSRSLLLPTPSNRASFIILLTRSIISKH
jgi:hypothetical protein